MTPDRHRSATVRRSRVAFRDLSATEIEEMLTRHHVGRLAFTFRDRVDIEPIHFVYDDGALFGRTSPGTKLSVLEHHPWVALEIDEIDGPFDWRSVVVKGTVYFIEHGASSALSDAYDHAIRALRTLMRDAFTEDDPVPSRTAVFRLHINELHGRAAVTTQEN